MICFIGKSEERSNQHGGFSPWRNYTQQLTTSIMITSWEKGDLAVFIGVSFGMDHRWWFDFQLPCFGPPFFFRHFVLMLMVEGYIVVFSFVNFYWCPFRAKEKKKDAKLQTKDAVILLVFICFLNLGYLLKIV